MHHSPTNWKEAQRCQAWQHQQKGWSQRQIAEALDVSVAAVSQWMRRARAGGLEALRHRPPPGAPRRLSADQLARLHCAVAPHFRSLWRPGAGLDLWQDRRCDAPRVWRLLSSCSCRLMPQRTTLEPAKARTASAPARRHGHHPLAGGDLACAQKGAQAQGQTTLFIDESGFYPWPSVVRTYAPIGQTPILREWRMRDHLSAIRAVSPAGQRYFHCQD